MQLSDDVESNEAYGILDKVRYWPVRNACTATKGTVYHNGTTPSVQSETSREIGMTLNEAYGYSRINSKNDNIKNAMEQNIYDSVPNL